MKVKYKGDAEPPVRAYGTTFEKGKAAEVHDRFKAKVEDNPYFEVAGGKSKSSGDDGDKPTAQGRPRTPESAGSREAVDIPDDWESLSWQEKRSLASQLSDDPVMSGDDADKAIRAEVNSRK